MNEMSRRNVFDVRAARERCRRYRRRILDISQQVQALHIGSAFSCTEIVDGIYHGLLRRNLDGTSPDTRHSAYSPAKTSIFIASRMGASAATPTTAIRGSKRQPARLAMGYRWWLAWLSPNAVESWMEQSTRC